MIFVLFMICFITAVFQAVQRHGLVKRRSFLLLFAPTHHLRLDGYEKQCSINSTSFIKITIV